MSGRQEKALPSVILQKRVIFFKKGFDGFGVRAYKAPPDDAGRSEELAGSGVGSHLGGAAVRQVKRGKGYVGIWPDERLEPEYLVKQCFVRVMVQVNLRV